MRFEPLAFFLSMASEAHRFGRAVRLCDHAADGKAVPVLHERMAHVTELGLAPIGLAIELGFRVSRALMGVALARLAVKVRVIIALRGLPRLEAFVRITSLGQRALERALL